MSFQPKAMFLTHFSRVEAQPKLATSLHQQIDELVAIAESLKHHPNRHDSISDAIKENLLTRLETHGTLVSKDKCVNLLAVDIELNTQGLEVWLESQP